MCRVTLVVFCLATALGAARGQSNYATVSGSVLDPQRHPVSGARVQMTERGTGAQRDVASNANGIYEIAGLQQGTYVDGGQRRVQAGDPDYRP